MDFSTSYSNLSDQNWMLNEQLLLSGQENNYQVENNY